MKDYKMQAMTERITYRGVVLDVPTEGEIARYVQDVLDKYTDYIEWESDTDVRYMIGYEPDTHTFLPYYEADDLCVVFSYIVGVVTSDDVEPLDVVQRLEESEFFGGVCAGLRDDLFYKLFMIKKGGAF